MSLELNPVELGFRRTILETRLDAWQEELTSVGPFDREVEEKLGLHNPNSDPVAFKVKTTAPKQYCVRPNSGRIEPGETVEVSVLLQRMNEEPPADAKCRDKFLVQSVAVSASDEISNVQTIWNNIEQTARSSIQEKKIRVNFLPAQSSTSSGGPTVINSGPYNASANTSTPSRGSTTMYSATEDPPAYSSPTTNQTPQSTYGGAQAYSSAQKSTSAGSDPRAADTSPSGQANPPTDPTTYSNMVTGSVAAAGQSIASVLPTNAEDLKAQLAEARNQVASLTQQASEGLRQRKATGPSGGVGGEGEKGGMAMQQAPGGVPVPLVAALCLLSFLIAYLLF